VLFGQARRWCGARHQAQLCRGCLESVVSLPAQAATARSHGPGSNGGERAPRPAVRVSLPRAWPIPRVPGPRAAPRTAGVQSSRASRNPSAPIPLRGQRRSPRRAYSRTRPAPRKLAHPALPAAPRPSREGTGAEPNARCCFRLVAGRNSDLPTPLLVLLLCQEIDGGVMAWTGRGRAGAARRGGRGVV
jgi:hypothetical protein